MIFFVGFFQSIPLTTIRTLPCPFKGCLMTWWTSIHTPVSIVDEILPAPSYLSVTFVVRFVGLFCAWDGFESVVADFFRVLVTFFSAPSRAFTAFDFFFFARAAFASCLHFSSSSISPSSSSTSYSSSSTRSSSFLKSNQRIQIIRRSAAIKISAHQFIHLSM